ncbi:MAG: hypothetical protein JO131_04545 [Gammaproteobacteria bacterium]|nr:hypothetical protein [Gammaproteobacteria bacterium]
MFDRRLTLDMEEDKFEHSYHLEKISTRLNFFNHDSEAKKMKETRQSYYIKSIKDHLYNQLAILAKILPDISKGFISTSTNPSADAKKILNDITNAIPRFGEVIDRFNVYCGNPDADPCFLEKTISEIRKFAEFAEGILKQFEKTTIELDKSGRKLHGFDFETLRKIVKPVIDIASSVSMCEQEEKPSLSIKQST